MNYKTVVPDLVSLETNIKKIGCFYLLRNLDYFGNSKNKLKFHFKAEMNNKIKKPAGYDFRNSRYWVKNDIWSYNFSMLGFSFIFQYDYVAKKFSFNSFSEKLPFRFNWAHPAGDHLADLINLELFTNGIIVLNGIAFRHNNNVCVFCTPSQNGKTTFLNKNKKRFTEIISDDYIVVDLVNKKIVNTPLLGQKESISSAKWQPIDKINLIINSESSDVCLQYTTREFIKMSAMKFSDNIFIKNLIFYYHLEEAIGSVLDKAELSNIFKINNIKNYDYEQFVRS